MSKIVIIGAGEFAQIAYEYFTHDSEHDVIGFCVEREYLTQTELFGLPITALEDMPQQYPADDFLAFIGIPASNMNRLRKRLYTEVKKLGYKFASYISSHAFIWHNAEIGENTFIFENNVVQPFTRIGNNCILWSGNHIGHRTVIHDHCFLSSHVVVSGYCDVGSGSFLGVNSTLNDNIKIGEYCLVGSGAQVVKDTEAEKIYVGSPARAVPGKSSFDAGI
ncbi:acetyltransferase [Aeromonas enteropelogenes]|uniref:acetyltransferase n=1 Tax=Aeromonas enteropelogenes TaxID=29489 RepID=UPI003B9DC76E